MPDHTVDWDGHRALLPAGGRALDDLVEVSSWYDSEDRRDDFCRRALAGRGRGSRSGRVTLQVALVHRPDNDYNDNAISVAFRGPGHPEDRHLGYLRDHYLRAVGETLLPDLAAFVRRRGGRTAEVLCTAVILGRDELALDLPEPEQLGRAIEKLLLAHDPGHVTEVRPPWDKRPGRLAADANRRHTRDSAQTRQAMEWSNIFTSPHEPASGIHVSATRHHRRPRSLTLRDSTTGRHLGEVALGYLFLADERDRPDVLRMLDEAGVPVAQPRPLMSDAEGWPKDAVPNMWTYWRTEGLDLRPRDPGGTSSEISVAHYNPTTRVLWVEDSRLVPATRTYAARLGLDVARVGLPTSPWGLERDVPWFELVDATLRTPRTSGADVRLCPSSRDLVPTDELFAPTLITWEKPSGPTRDPGRQFLLHERFVEERRRLFGPHDVGDVGACRLCGSPGLELRTPVCVTPLVYCHACLEHAARGVGRDRRRAARALRLLGELEFDEAPMLESQLDTLHLNPAEPVTGALVDQLLLLRFAIARKQFAWTLLLEAAGFAGEGLRISRGTLIRARDGHLCHSMREKAVCDFLHQHGVEHEREPTYPFDADFNPTGRRRADWLLSDGTLVELWGFPNQPVYAAKMEAKRRLARRRGLRLIEITDAELPKLPNLFADWLPDGVQGETTWAWSPLRRAEKRTASPPAGDDRGGNDFNTALRRERLDRSQRAVRLQREGLSRKEIATSLGVSPELVKQLLRDGKFFAVPSSDPARAALAEAAYKARTERLTREEFRVREGLSRPKAQEAWRDADVLHEMPTETSMGGLPE